MENTSTLPMFFTMFRFKYGQTVIELHFLFIAVITLCLWLSETQAVLLSLCVALIHETGHLLACCLVGHPPQLLSLHLFGMTLKQLHPSRITFLQQQVIYLAGCSLNLLIFFLCWALCMDADQLSLFAVMNLTLGLLNLLPIQGLDGANIVELWALTYLDGYVAHRLMQLIQFLILLLLTLSAGYYLYYIGYSFTLILLCIYLWCSLLRN